MSDVLQVKAQWRVREYRGGLLVAERSRHNLFTDYGLSNLASLWGASGTPPVYLVIDSFSAGVHAHANAGATSIQTDAKVNLTGDTQIVINPGGITEETVAFSSVTGSSSPFTYNLSSPLANAHETTERIVRAVRQADTMSSVQSEVQYDAAAAPNQRMKVPSGSGYSQGTGSWTMQFFLTGSQALDTGGADLDWMTLGLADNLTVGAGNLHNHLVFGFTHSQGNDVELDITLTITNS